MIIEDLNREVVIRENMSKFIQQANCYGVPRGLTGYKRNEYENLLITEERSVAAYTYRNEINAISRILDECLKSHYYKSFQINLNEIEGINITWSEEFIIIFKFANCDEVAEYLDAYTIIKDSKVKKVAIVVRVNPYNHNEDLMYQFLYHEFNHCKEDIERLMNGKQSISDSLNSKIDYQKAYDALLSNHNDRIAYIIYNLFADTELNAYVSQLYGEMEKKPSKREDFHMVLKNTDAYKRYDGFNYIIETLETQEGWEPYAMSFFFKKFPNQITFRTWFINRAKRQTLKFWTKMGKVASLYYDTLEKTNKTLTETSATKIISEKQLRRIIREVIRKIIA